MTRHRVFLQPNPISLALGTFPRSCATPRRRSQVIEKAYKKLRLDALVIQQGRLTENTKTVNKDDLLSMVRYGAEMVFSSSVRALACARHYAAVSIRVHMPFACATGCAGLSDLAGIASRQRWRASCPEYGMLHACAAANITDGTRLHHRQGRAVKRD